MAGVPGPRSFPLQGGLLQWAALALRSSTDLTEKFSSRNCSLRLPVLNFFSSTSVVRLHTRIIQNDLPCIPHVLSTLYQSLAFPPQNLLHSSSHITQTARIFISNLITVNFTYRSSSICNQFLPFC